MKNLTQGTKLQAILNLYSITEVTDPTERQEFINSNPTYSSYNIFKAVAKDQDTEVLKYIVAAKSVNIFITNLYKFIYPPCNSNPKQ